MWYARPMNKTIAILLGVIVVVAAGVYVMRDKKIDDGGVPLKLSPTATMPPPPTPVVSVGASIAPGASVKVFAVIGDSFSFNLKEIRVKKGDNVRIVFTNTQGIHDWVVDAFNARTSKIQAGQTATVEFTADKTGTFEYYCSVGNHRAQGMKGTLIVE